MASCLVLTGLEGQMPAEGEEVLNLLSEHDFKIKRLTMYSPLELYRASDGGPFDLVWVGCHSGEQGFLIGNNILNPNELGLFLKETAARDVFLNSCFSAQFVDMIQRYAMQTNIVATIQPAIPDNQAWVYALYFCKAFVRTKSLEVAYNEILSGGRTYYYWFPARSHVGNVESGERAMPDTLSQLTRAIKGDPFTGQPGILETLQRIQTSMEAQAQQQRTWQTTIENRLENLEERMTALEKNVRSGGSYLILDRKTVVLLFIGFVFTLMLIFALTKYLGG